MWIFTLDGFYSVVADQNNPDRLLVRARAMEDADRMAGFLNDTARYTERVEVQHTPDADYAYRMFVSRNLFALAMGNDIRNIEYTNFKARVHEDRGLARTLIYEKVWGFMRDALQGHA